MTKIVESVVSTSQSNMKYILWLADLGISLQRKDGEETF